MGSIAHPPDRETRISRIAARQKLLITFAQLRDCGLSRNAIAARARSGRLYRLHLGVFAAHPPPHSREQTWLAAVLACRPGALLSDEPSALLQNLLSEGPVLPQVTVAGSTSRSRPGLVVHRRLVDPRDIRRVDGIPCTSADRILIDLAPRRGQHELELIMVAADSLGLLKRHRLAELVEERRGRPGMPKLEALLALEPRIARSELEVLFDPVWRAAGLPRPLFNHQRLALAGWTPHRFVRRAVKEEPLHVAERLLLLASLPQRTAR